jgi:hypothetical protein
MPVMVLFLYVWMIICVLFKCRELCRLDLPFICPVIVRTLGCLKPRLLCSVVSSLILRGSMLIQPYMGPV